ncbi:uncharacterized protein PITG_10406 [Phytophthora infestans T30-4]|uniref:Uncharacterized protein n=1 Tax=Phytophthora infestans (strain T30-4) TaxID=403677 RepID=D0NF90_PHYIT|nr:uncharacterized protein PITG_10406 [Phytophthora infestans T30-4]EEY56879.1 hypothetical protein PITG_10406 [Phytophthora infestans T30-4]|eukprot:XP_002902207.1 hypothetical protein PITG_10406 [Phytophthora infestans T30-4]
MKRQIQGSRPQTYFLPKLHTYKDMPWDSPYRLPTRETETRGTTQEISLRQVVHFKPTATGGRIVRDCQCWCDEIRYREDAGAGGIPPLHENLLLNTYSAVERSLVCVAHYVMDVWSLVNHFGIDGVKGYASVNASCSSSRPLYAAATTGDDSSM